MPSLSLSFLAQLATFKLRVKTLAEGVLTGLHASSLQGQSVEFAEHKEYAPGDELRHLDWKVLGKTERYFIKRFQHEANLPLLLVLDASGSMGYGPEGQSKLDAAKLLAGALAWVAAKQQDAIGLLSFSQPNAESIPHNAERLTPWGAGGEQHSPSGKPAAAFEGKHCVQGFPPKAHANQLPLVLSQLETLEARGEVHVEGALEMLLAQLRRRSLLVVFSDLLGERPSMLQKLLRLRKQKHDVALFHILHSDETDFPFEEPTLFLSLEGEERLEAHPLHLRQSYLEQMGAFLEETQTQCRAADVDYALVKPQTPLEETLIRFFTRRKRGRRK